MSFEPLVDPFALQPDGTAAADASVPQLPTFARGVDGVAAHPRVLSIQRRIADILSTYDDLIEKSLRRIQILEEMAHALYREWFVEFRCPGCDAKPLVPSDLGKVLAMPRVSSRMAALCQEHGWSWYDLAGNCRLEIPGVLLIERSGKEPIKLQPRGRANLSTPEAARVVRALLAPGNADQRWTQREMVAHFADLTPRVQAPSLALVNKVVQHLRDQAFLGTPRAELASNATWPASRHGTRDCGAPARSGDHRRTRQTWDER